MVNLSTLFRKAAPLAPPRTYDPALIRYAYSIGDDLFTDDGVRSTTLEQQYRQLQLGASGVSDYGLADVMKLSVPAFACINYFATTASTIPLKIETPGIGQEYHPFVYFMDHADTIIEETVRSLLIWGKAYLRKQYNQTSTGQRGYPTGLEVLHPMHVRQRLDHQTYEIIGYDLQYPREQLLPDEVVYVRLFDPMGDGNPLSPLENAFTHCGIEQGIASNVLSFFFNHALPVMVVVFDPPIGTNEFQLAQAMWKKNYKGIGKSGQVGFLNGKVTLTPITQPPKDWAMEGLTDSTKQMICAAFNVPPALVGLGDTSAQLFARTSYEDTRRAFLTDTVIPLVTKITTCLTEYWTYPDFSPPEFYSLVPDPMGMSALSEVNDSRVSIFDTMLKNGAWDYDEGRDFLNLPERDYENEDVLYLRAHHSAALDVYNAEVVSLNEARMMIGLKPRPVDLVKFDGKTIPVNDIGKAAQSNVVVEPPAPIGLPPGTIAPLALPAVSRPPALPSGNGKVAAVQSRAAYPATLEIDFANHTFVKMARRQLAKQLGNIPGITWVNDEEWRLPIMTLADCPPETSARVIRELQLSNQQRIELWASRYTYHDNAIWWVCDRAPLSAVTDRLSGELSSRFEVQGTALPEAEIKLALIRNFDEALLPEAPPTAPLIADNITLYTDGQRRHQWVIEQVSGDQRRELSAWRHKAMRSQKRGEGYDVTFAPDTLPQHVVDYLNTALAQPRVDLSAIFDEAKTRLENRAIQSTKGDFMGAMETLLGQAVDGAIDQRTFSILLGALISQYGYLAYRDGLIDGGVTDGVFSADDDKALQDLIEIARSYITGIADALYQDGLTSAEVLGKPLMWFNGALVPIYQAGLLSANDDGMYEFTRTNDTKEPCPDCLRLEGQRHRLYEWEEHNLLVPRPEQATECKGYQCGHELTPTTGRAKGEW